MSHVPALQHVKDPIRFSVNYESDSKIGGGGIVPAFAGGGLAHLGMNAGTC
jgi:hypothetical protein